MRSWVVSPNVEAGGKASIEAWTDFIRESGRVFMGWGADDKLGQTFMKIALGDLVLVARGSNRNKRLVACGFAVSAPTDVPVDGAPTDHWSNQVKLVPFVRLTEESSSYGLDFTGTKYLNANRIPAIYELEPSNNERDRAVVEMLRQLVEKERSKRMLDDHVAVLKRFGQIVLEGPPGTGKTYIAKRLAARLLGLDAKTVRLEEQSQGGDFAAAKHPAAGAGGTWSLVQFHPSYNYEDFVRGIEVRTTKAGTVYRTVDRILALMAKYAEKEKQKTAVLIIDEINRANAAAVMGELIYALEYRGCAVETPYALESKGEHESSIRIPRENFFVIATMNTADRSIGHLDYAIRRRFAFLPLLPDLAVLRAFYGGRAGDEDGLAGDAERLFRAVAALFDEGGCLSRDYSRDDVQVGHTYFMAADRDELLDKYVYQVHPLLREYYKDGVLTGREVTVDLGAAGVALPVHLPAEATQLRERLDAGLRATEEASSSDADAE